MLTSVSCAWFESGLDLLLALSVPGLDLPESLALIEVTFDRDAVVG